MYKEIKQKNIFIFTSLLLASIYLLFKINEIALSEVIYGGPIFYIGFGGVSFYQVFVPLISIFSLCYFYYKPSVNKTKDRPIIFAILFFALSILFKLTLFNFDLNLGDYSETIDKIFNKGWFNDYKTYNYLAFYLSQITEDYNYYLSVINIVLGSATIGIMYLILTEIGISFSSRNLIIIFILLYIPLSAIDTILRVDSLYNFLFTISIYLSLMCFKKENFRYILILNIIFLILCFTKEQTIYLLPLYIGLFLFSKINNKKILIISLLITTTVTSLSISYSNNKNYGIDSKYRDFHLVVKLMQYGYLNDGIKDRYFDQLSNNEKKLLNDINTVYKNNILPHKREGFKNHKFPLHYLIHPDEQNIFLKSYRTKYKGDIYLVKQEITNKIKQLSSPDNKITMTQLESDFLEDSTLQNKDDKNLSIFLKSIIVNQYIHQMDLCKPSPDTTNLSNDDEYSADCLIGLLDAMDKNFMRSRSDNWFYSKSGLAIALNFDEEKKAYYQHGDIDLLKGILLKYPYLYLSQSLLTATGLVGITPYGLLPQKYYKNSILPEWLLRDSEIFYKKIVNFWYVFSIFSIISVIMLYKNNAQRNKNIFISLIPIYYGIFISFATYAEFARIMIPAVPFIIFSFFNVTLFISERVSLYFKK